MRNILRIFAIRREERILAIVLLLLLPLGALRRAASKGGAL